MTAQQVSLVIVSQGRPDHLANMLQSLRHQTHPDFEVVVVADHLPDGFKDVRFIKFAVANISAARNIGIQNSTADLIAFCDDDAIPDPPWLERLLAPFAHPDVGSTTGFTRGRNGISRQWGAMRFDHNGQDHPFDMDESTFQIFDADPDMPIKLIGTNMAFCRAALLAVGGFDEGFRFFLDETDIKMRLDLAGWKSAIVPTAQVHHHFASSPRRGANRVPTDLFEIGASKSYFCSKYAPDETFVTFTQEQYNRLFAHAKHGHVEAEQIGRVMQTLTGGIADGKLRKPSFPDLDAPSPAFHPFPTGNGKHVVLCAGPFDGAWLKQTASELLNDGYCVSAIKLCLSAKYFQVCFKDGYWQHEGGVFGKSDRTQPLLKFQSFAQRFSDEVDRIKKYIPVEKVLYKNSDSIDT